MEIQNTSGKLNCLVIFRELLQDPLIILWQKLLKNIIEGQDAAPDYCAFLARLYEEGGDFGEHLFRIVMDSENIFIKRESSRKNPSIINCLEGELELFTEISSLSPQELITMVESLSPYSAPLPEYLSTPEDFKSLYGEKVRRLPTEGYGIFAKHRMFMFSERGITPVLNPDQQSLVSLVGYSQEQKPLIANTLSLLGDNLASNTLLYGDAGTGKSSTIKALVNEYHEMGLRLVEIKKKHLHLIPDLMDELKDNPLKFIVFVDDLTFTQQDENFSALKSALEGSASTQNRNTVIYATSNRRHLIKENMSDRQDGLNENDTIQETMGLAARFGLTITYQRPDREVYHQIVKEYANEFELLLDEKTLFTKAEAYAIRNGGRSPRAAKQFVHLEKGLSE